MKIVLIGKTNVGKSTLFNRIIEEKRALVSREAHTTRDRIYGQYLWRGEKFTIVDVGGISTEKLERGKTDIEEGIKNQIRIALEEADLIVFLLDIKAGINIEDRVIAQQLKKISARGGSPPVGGQAALGGKKELILAVNKVDGQRDREKAVEENFLRLGFGKPILVSAVSGAGVGDLLDRIYNKIKEIKKKSVPEKELLLGKNLIRLAVFGRTNVGKSTLINSLLDEERLIVTPFPHTTREPIDSYFFYKDKEFVLIDTAGARRKTKVKSEIERLGIKKTFETIKKADIVLLIFDMMERVSHLDQRLAELIKKERKGLILVVNKIDLGKTRVKKYIEYYENQFIALWWAPVVFISAKEKINLDKLLDNVLMMKDQMETEFDKIKLDNILKRTIAKYKFSQKYWLKAKIHQIKDTVPNFMIIVPRITNKEIMPREAQIKLLEKKIREEFSLWGVPIQLKVQS